MADVSHELGALRFVVDSPLSSKVAMFNNQANQHKKSQLLNPFSNTGSGRTSPKPTFSKDEYGKPLAGSLTELRGQKANMHVLREMLELCQIIDSEGYKVNDEPNMRVIPFGELFNIYNYISDKVVGILLRARKHKLVEFEGEMLFQRRDDDVPIFLVKPIQDIRKELEDKIEDIKRSSSPAPQATSVLLDRSAYQNKFKRKPSISAPGSQRNSKSRSPSPVNLKSASPPPQLASVPSQTPNTSKAPSPAKDVNSLPKPSKAPQIAPKPVKLSPNHSKAPSPAPGIPAPVVVPTLKSVVSAPQILIECATPTTAPDLEIKAEHEIEPERKTALDEKLTESTDPVTIIEQQTSEVELKANGKLQEDQSQTVPVQKLPEPELQTLQEAVVQLVESQQLKVEEPTPIVESLSAEDTQSQQESSSGQEQSSEITVDSIESGNDKADVNNNDNNRTNNAVIGDDLPTVVIEATGVFVRSRSSSEPANESVATGDAATNPETTETPLATDNPTA